MYLYRFNGLDPVRAPENTPWQERHKIETISENELERIFGVEIEEDNIWGQNEEFAIYKGKDGFGVYHEVPGGYSSMTYDPQTIERYYENCDWEWFVNFGLDQEQRDLLDGFKP